MVREFRENDEHEESLDDDIREQDDIEHLNKTESEFRQTLSENDKTIANETSLPLLLNDALRFVPVKDDPLLISAVRELAQIRDTATLEMELEKFPHLREKLEFRLMYSTCETYFKASHYRDALYRSETTFGAIAATLTTYPE